MPGVRPLGNLYMASNLKCEHLFVNGGSSQRGVLSVQEQLQFEIRKVNPVGVSLCTSGVPHAPHIHTQELVELTLVQESISASCLCTVYISQLQNLCQCP